MSSRSEDGRNEGGGKNAQKQCRGVVCSGCGYDLSGRVGSVCSECGLELRVVAADQGRFYRQTGVMLLANWAVLIGVVLAVVFGMTVVNEHRWHVKDWEEMQTSLASDLSYLKGMHTRVAAMGMAEAPRLLSTFAKQIAVLEEMESEMSSVRRPILIDKRLVIPELGFGLSLLGLICAVLALLANRIVVRSIQDEASGVGKLERRARVLSFAAVWGCSLALLMLAWETIH